VTGLDYSSHLLDVARERGTASNLRYVRGDMRALPAKWSGRFAAVLNLFTSFGFFLDPADDTQVIHELARVLRPNGVSCGTAAAAMASWPNSCPATGGSPPMER
jgi:Methylase involved in ubiquinone/menaquinone biosynthesis